MNGVIPAISIDSEKVLDKTVLSKSCKSCSRMQTIKAKCPHAYNKWNTARENAYGPEKPAQIYEFIVHYQKRVETRLRKKTKT